MTGTYLDAEKVFNHKVYFDLNDKLSVHEIKSLDKFFFGDFYKYIKIKVDNLKENNVKYHTITDNKDTFIFDFALSKMDKESIAYLYDNLYLICSNKNIDILIDMTYLDFEIIDIDYLYEDLEKVFRSTSNNYKYNKLRFIYCKKEVSETLIEIFNEKFDVVEITYKNVYR